MKRKIKIGAYTLKVRYRKHEMTDVGECGNYNSRTKTISLDPDVCPDMLNGVLFHEVVEAIKDIYHIKCLQDDHNAIEQLGDAFFQFVRDNPKIVREFS